MLKEAGLSDLSKKRIPREQCIFVARKRGNDELAPSAELLREFNTKKRELEAEFGKGSTQAHNRAYEHCAYERRFRAKVEGDSRALARLEELSRRAGKEDIYLVCYEGLDKACHRRILLRIAEELFNAEVSVEGFEGGEPN